MYIFYQHIMNFCSYVSAYYFVTTTATTVGYGDYVAKTSGEKTYEIFLEMGSLVIFSMITG
jgi:hypothetical protein